MADVPHLAWPFRMAGRALAQVEQDSIEDVQQNVRSYLSTARGERTLSPDFGAEDLTFAGQVDSSRLKRDIEASEDRAAVTVTATPIDRTGRTAINVVVELAE
jgi:hypothetical protein